MRLICITREGQTYLRELRESLHFHEPIMIQWGMAILSPGFIDGEVVDSDYVELVWQQRFKYDWCDSPEDFKWIHCELYDIKNIALEHRQIYRRKQQSEKTDTVISLLNNQKISDQSKRDILVKMYDMTTEDALNVFPDKQSQKFDMVSKKAVLETLIRYYRENDYIIRYPSELIKLIGKL